MASIADSVVDDLMGATPTQQSSVADEAVSSLLSPEAPRTPAAPKAITLDDLPLANKDAGVSDKTVAGFDTLRKAAMVDDPGTKLKIFAEARFPKDPNAIERYGMVDGEPVYLGDDGKAYRELPSGFTGWLKGAAAGIAGAPGETAGAVLGGIAGAPGGPAGIAALSAAGAAGGRGFDKVAANLTFDEPQTVEGNAKSMLVAGAFGAGGSLMGSALGKWMGRNVARDISKFDTKAGTDLTRKAADIGVDLDVAQITNLPSLKGKADVLASAPTSRDIMGDAATKRAGQAYKAAERFINRLSPKDGLDEAGEVARDAASKVIANVTKERADAARPLYEAAFGKFQGLPSEVAPQLDELLKRPDMARAMRSAERLAKNEGIDLADPKSSLLGMHYAKLALDDMIDGAGAQGMGAVRKRQLVGMKGELVGIMDNLSPDYAKAREVFAHFSPTVTAVKQGVVSKLAGLSDGSIHRASQMVFNGSSISPKSVGKTRELFVKGGLEQDWNTLLASYLRETFEQAGKATATPGGAVTQAPKWSATMMNPRQYRVMEKGMSPQQFQGFRDMLDVFNAMGRTAYAGAGSQTMPRQEAMKVMQRDAGTGALGKIATAVNPLEWSGAISRWVGEARLGKHAEKMAQVLTSPDGMTRLKELKRLSPRDQKFIAGMSNLFAISLAPEGVGAPANVEAGQ